MDPGPRGHFLYSPPGHKSKNFWILLATAFFGSQSLQKLPSLSMQLLEPQKFKNSNSSVFMWALGESSAFRQLSKVPCEGPALALFDTSKPF